LGDVRHGQSLFPGDLTEAQGLAAPVLLVAGDLQDTAQAVFFLGGDFHFRNTPCTGRERVFRLMSLLNVYFYVNYNLAPSRARSKGHLSRGASDTMGPLPEENHDSRLPVGAWLRWAPGGGVREPAGGGDGPPDRAPWGPPHGRTLDARDPSGGKQGGARFRREAPRGGMRRSDPPHGRGAQDPGPGARDPSSARADPGGARQGDASVPGTEAGGGPEGAGARARDHRSRAEHLGRAAAHPGRQGERARTPGGGAGVWHQQSRASPGLEGAG